MGFLSNLIKGKKTTTQADAISGDLKSLRKSGTGLQRLGINILKEQDPTAALASQMTGEQRAIRGAGQDEARRATQMAAQRGLGSSSIGMAMQNNAFRNTAQRLAQNQGARGSRLFGMQSQRAGTLMDRGSNLIAQGGPIRMNAVTKRSGGLGGVIGTIGGALGAKAMGMTPGEGAKLGGSIGKGFQG